MGRPKGGIPWNKGQTGVYTPERLEAMRRACPEGCVCGRHRPVVHSMETRAKLSAAKRGKALPPFSEEHRRRLSAAGKGKVHARGVRRSDAMRARISVVKKLFYVNPANRKAHSVCLTKAMADPAVRQAISERQLLKWQDPEYAHKVLSANAVRPNQGELRLLAVLKPDGFRYVGDGRFIVGGKSPDFWDGDKRLVELYGDYWHRNDDPQERIDYFARYGYKCRVIWASELEKVERDGIAATEQ